MRAPCHRRGSCEAQPQHCTHMPSLCTLVGPCRATGTHVCAFATPLGWKHAILQLMLTPLAHVTSSCACSLTALAKTVVRSRMRCSRSQGGAQFPAYSWAEVRPVHLSGMSARRSSQHASHRCMREFRYTSRRCQHIKGYVCGWCLSGLKHWRTRRDRSGAGSRVAHERPLPLAQPNACQQTGDVALLQNSLAMATTPHQLPAMAHCRSVLQKWA